MATNASEEHQYLNLVREILADDIITEGRNGEVYSIFGANMRFTLTDGIMPILTTKKMAWRTCLKELLWFISGNTDNTALRAQGVHIWTANGSREFLDSRGLQHYRQDDLGPVYGHQWRSFNAPYTTCDEDYTAKGVDQLQNIINALNDPKQRTSRRLIMSAWNPCQLNQMALPPCHITVQFNVDGRDRLSCALYQRSGDVGLGVPFNIASYAFLTHLIAHHCGLVAHQFVHFIGNAHIYKDHKQPMLQQLSNAPHPFPRLTIARKCADIGEYTFADFNVTDYVHHPAVKMDMVA